MLRCCAECGYATVYRMSVRLSVTDVRVVSEKSHDAVMKFDTYRSLRRYRAVLPAIARLSCTLSFFYFHNNTPILSRTVYYGWLQHVCMQGSLFKSVATYIWVTQVQEYCRPTRNLYQNIARISCKSLQWKFLHVSCMQNLTTNMADNKYIFSPKFACLTPSKKCGCLRA